MISYLGDFECSGCWLSGCLMFRVFWYFELLSFEFLGLRVLVFWSSWMLEFFEWLIPFSDWVDELLRYWVLFLFVIFSFFEFVRFFFNCWVVESAVCWLAWVLELLSCWVFECLVVLKYVFVFALLVALRLGGLSACRFEFCVVFFFELLSSWVFEFGVLCFQFLGFFFLVGFFGCLSF